MKKEDARLYFANMRNQLTQVEYENLCLKLFQQFQKIDLSNINCIHLFLTIHNRKEPDTFIIRDWLKTSYPQIKLVLPKTDFTDHSMQSYTDDADLELAINAFGLTEPIAGNEADANEIDLVLLPLLAFDKQGCRVGYGKGFYDRFIATCKPNVQLVGLSFFDPADKIDDLDEFDKKMTACITPTGVIRF